MTFPGFRTPRAIDSYSLG
jgi:hypothetical protein